MSIKLAIISAFLALVSGSALPQPQFHVGKEAMCHEKAREYCQRLGSRLADVNQANRGQLISALQGKPGWIASWDSNYYTGSCTYSINDHIGPSECSNSLFPVCNPLPAKPHPHHGHEHPHSSHSHEHSHSSHGHDHEHSHSHSSHGPGLYKSFNVEAAEEKGANHHGPRRSRRSFSADGSVAAAEVPFQYVYLTNTVTTSFTSSLTVTTTTTSVFTEIIGTVAAFTVTESA